VNSLKALLYFSIFNYPLKKEEIFSYTSLKNKENLDNELSLLIEKGAIYKIDKFYTCSPKKEFIERRKKGNKMAQEIYMKAIQIANFIAKFPFVEGVGISGSLSKGYFDKESDVDFFVITTPNKLWIARMFLVLYRKIFLLGSIDFFCVNYYITTENLEIIDKNRFTATELATLIPVCGKQVFTDFYKYNEWICDFFGNFTPKKQYLSDVNKPFLTKTVEFLLKNQLGKFFEKVFMKITYQIKKIKFRHVSNEVFNSTIKSTSNVSKHHPKNYQKKVIETLNKKYLEIQQKYDIYLTPEDA